MARLNEMATLRFRHISFDSESKVHEVTQDNMIGHLVTLTDRKSLGKRYSISFFIIINHMFFNIGTVKHVLAHDDFYKHWDPKLHFDTYLATLKNLKGYFSSSSLSSTPFEPDDFFFPSLKLHNSKSTLNFTSKKASKDPLLKFLNQVVDDMTDDPNFLLATPSLAGQYMNTFFTAHTFR